MFGTRPRLFAWRLGASKGRGLFVALWPEEQAPCLRGIKAGWNGAFQLRARCLRRRYGNAAHWGGVDAVSFLYS